MSRRPPGVTVEEVSSITRSILSVETSIVGFIGIAPDPRADRLDDCEDDKISDMEEFRNRFCRPILNEDGKFINNLEELNKDEQKKSRIFVNAIHGFFLNGRVGDINPSCYIINIGEEKNFKEGLKVLERIDEVAIVAAPGFTKPEHYEALLSHCEKLKDRFAILDSAEEFNSYRDFEMPATGDTEAEKKVVDTPKKKVDEATPGNSDDVTLESDSEGELASTGGGEIQVSSQDSETDVATSESAPRPRKNRSATSPTAISRNITSREKRSTGKQTTEQQSEKKTTSQSGLRPRYSNKGYGAAYFPWIKVNDILKEVIPEYSPLFIPPSGHIAGFYARVDLERGVHKAPASLDAEYALRGADKLSYKPSKEETGDLNFWGINCLDFSRRKGAVFINGERTLAESNQLEWRYVSIRRLFIMIEESIQENTGWIVHEPNNKKLWLKIRQQVRRYLRGLCDRGTLESFQIAHVGDQNPGGETEPGYVYIILKLAPAYPAEFVTFTVSQRVDTGESGEF